jgi:hypothetical protein
MEFQALYVIVLMDTSILFKMEHSNAVIVIRLVLHAMLLLLIVLHALVLFSFMIICVLLIVPIQYPITMVIHQTKHAKLVLQTVLLVHHLQIVPNVVTIPQQQLLGTTSLVSV